jgi:hypothetical protein
MARLRRRTDAPDDAARLARVGARLLGVLALVGIEVLRVYRPPPPARVDAPVETFSALRARAVLRQLLADGVPHPLGSKAQARYRQQLVAAWGGVGVEATVQRARVCGASGSCGAVENVIALVGGGEEEPGAVAEAPPEGGAPLVLVTAHYDSVPVGPGASDDSLSVAAQVEMGRALRAAGGPPGRPVVFLATDGEEAGLLGAEAFLQEHPLARRVTTVINLDSRGAGGVPILFQVTGDAARGLSLATALPRPALSTAYQEAYPWVPGDTDLSVFRRAGRTGLDVACLGDITRYHSPRDDLAGLNLGSLQAQGDAALALVRAARRGAPGVPDAPRTRRVAFDLLGRTVVGWSPLWDALMVILAALGLGLVSRELHQRRYMERRSITDDVVWLASVALGTAAVGFALDQVLRWSGALPGPFVATPWPMLASQAFLGGACASVACTRTWRWGGFWESWLAVWTWWTLAGALALVLAPGAAYLLLVPAALAAVGGVLTLWLPDPDSYPSTIFPVVLPVVVMAALWLPMVRMLYLATGFGLRVAYPLAVGHLLTPLIPLWSVQERGWRAAQALTFGLLAVVLAVVGWFHHPFSPAHPQGVGLTYHRPATGPARWMSGALWGPPPREFTEGLGLSSVSERPFPWSGRLARAHVAKASGPTPNQTVEVEVVRDEVEAGQRRLELKLTVPLGCRRAGVVLGPGPDLASARVDGRRVPLHRGERPHAEGRFRFLRRQRPDETVEVHVAWQGEERVQAWIYAVVPGVPPPGSTIWSEMPPETHPFHDGAATLLTREVEL